jgi:5-methylthioadenosine/S-adenosylhomocysteine deaminase
VPNLLITGATILTQASPPASTAVLPIGWLTIDDGRITGIGEGDPPPLVLDDANHILAGDGMIALPGLINGHTHFSQILVRGMGDGLPLLRWLHEVIWPLEGAITPDEMYLAARLSIAEQLRNGATSIVQHHKIVRSRAHIEAALRAAEELGVRLQFNRLWVDSGTNSEPVDTMLVQMDALRHRWHGAAKGCITLGFGPSVPYRCSETGMLALLAQARAWGMPVHMHVAEARDEIAILQERTGKRHVEWLDALGALGPDMSLVHCVYLTEKELDLIAQSGSPVVHCPISNLYLGSGIAPIRKMLDRGISVAIGTDGAAAAGSQDILQTARTAALLARVQAGDASALTATTALRMATAGGAGLIAPVKGRGALGHLAVGAAADVVLIRTDTFGAAATSDPYGAVLYGSDGHDVQTVIINGRIVVEDGRILGVDEDQLLHVAEMTASSLRRRLSG